MRWSNNDKSDLSSSNNDPSNNNSFCFLTDQVTKLLSLISDKQGFNPVTNMAGLNLSFLHKNVEWVVDSGANQHYTKSDDCLDSVVDISDLNLRVDHPNGSSAKILKIGNSFLSTGIGLHDVLVVPDFNINLMSVHKVVKDNKLCVLFDENKCYFQDSMKNQIVGTGNEHGGLYVYNQKENESGKLKSNMVCCISKTTWHSRLGHPFFPVLDVLKGFFRVRKRTYPYL